MRRATCVSAALILFCGELQGFANAGMVLTSTAIHDGFHLSTFASGFSNVGNVGPTGIAFVSGGGVMVSDYPGNVRVFATDTDGQIASGGVVGQNYGQSNALGLAKVGNNIYMTQQSANGVVQVNANGTFNQSIVGGLTHATGVVADPANGHLFVSTAGQGQVWDVDPIAKTKTLFLNRVLDGMTTSADGKTLYGADGDSGHLLGFNISTKQLVFDSGFISTGVDGAVLGSGKLAGNIFVNTNGGTLVEINLTTGAQTLIADGGSRGDFVTVDPSTNTLLLTQSDSVLRLTPNTGGGFGGGGDAAPEPASLTLFSLGLASLALARMVGCRRRGAASH